MKDIDGYVTKDSLYRLISGIKRNPNIPVDDKTCSIIVEAISDMPKADIQPVDRWISVKDRLPEIIYNSSENVLIYLKNGEQYVAMYVGEDKDFGIEAYWSTSDMHRDFECDKVTRWQPLPEPPKDGDANG